MHEKPSTTELETLFRTCLTDEKVIEAFRNCSWFTPDYIYKARSERPPLDSLPTEKDQDLNLFINVFNQQENWGRVLRLADKWINHHMADTQDHSYPIGQMRFFDKEVKEQADFRGVNQDFQLDRINTILGVKYYLLCIICPGNIRKRAVQEMCTWGQDSYDLGTSVVLQALLIRKGVEQYSKIVTGK